MQRANCRSHLVFPKRQNGRADGNEGEEEDGDEQHLQDASSFDSQLAHASANLGDLAQQPPVAGLFEF